MKGSVPLYATSPCRLPIQAYRGRVAMATLATPVYTPLVPGQASTSMNRIQSLGSLCSGLYFTFPRSSLPALINILMTFLNKTSFPYNSYFRVSDVITGSLCSSMGMQYRSFLVGGASRALYIALDWSRSNYWLETLLVDLTFLPDSHRKSRIWSPFKFIILTDALMKCLGTKHVGYF